MKSAAGTRDGKEVIEYLLNRQGLHVRITEEALKSAAGNPNGKEIVEFLLDRRGPEVQITEDILKSAAGNLICGEGILELLTTNLNGKRARSLSPGRRRQPCGVYQ